jgi:hypothetical protein
MKLMFTIVVAMVATMTDVTQACNYGEEYKHTTEYKKKAA